MVELPDGTRLLHAIKPGEKLPMQFGREVSAKLCLEILPGREGWKLWPKESAGTVMTGRFRLAKLLRNFAINDAPREGPHN